MIRLNIISRLRIGILGLLLQGALARASIPVRQAEKDLVACGEAFYRENEYTCYNGSFLCPIVNGTPTKRCGDACYLPSQYDCSIEGLSEVSAGSQPSASNSTSSIDIPELPPIPLSDPPSCSSEPLSQFIPSPPYANYFLSTCHVQAHLILTSPLSSSNLSIIGPRLIAAFPAGNSGVAAFFAPESGVNGSLSLSLVNVTRDGSAQSLNQVYIKDSSGNSTAPSVGISAVLELNTSAVLTIPIMGSVRTIRDFTEGPSILVPEIQDGIRTSMINNSVVLERTWLDNQTVTRMGFIPVNDDAIVKPESNNTARFSAGRYHFWTAFDFPQLDQLGLNEVLSPGSQGLIEQQPSETSSLAFLSYTNKLLAGTWRFLTYFGRDSMIAALLLQPALSEGEGGAIEAVLGAVFERINRTDGSVSHEETLGDYATYLNQQMNVTSTDPSYTYQMIDTDYYLPILMNRYFNTTNGSSRAKAVLSTPAGSINPANANLTYGQLATISAEKIMGIAARFAAPGNQTKENLAHLKEDQIVGQWRDSTYGIGGGRIPYDVNTALMPAALHSISALAASGIYPHSDWASLASGYAHVWEASALPFFTTTLNVSVARSRLETYVDRSSFTGPSQANLIDGPITIDALALDGNNNLSKVEVMHTDTCFHLFLLNSTSDQATALLNRTATSIRRRFPAGLMSDVGLLVANPAFGSQEVYAANWTTSAYHGTVVWSWQMAMMARGLEAQLGRCESGGDTPAWCNDASVYGNVRGAYNDLWDVIEANEDHLSGEVWSWRYENNKFRYVELGELPPPEGTSPTESDVRQLWSLTFLAVRRNEALG